MLVRITCTLREVHGSSLAAFLEQILLDDSGNIRPQYNEFVAADSQRPAIVANTGDIPAAVLRQQTDVVDRAVQHQDEDDLLHDLSEVPERERYLLNPLKRKLDDAQPLSWSFEPDENNLLQYLPDQQVLCKVVEFFCISYHHFVPFIHKQRLKTRVREGVHSGGLDLLLHALVATTLRHMDPNLLFLDRDQIEQQIKVSRAIVETKSLQDVTIESLQSLILIVFNHVSDAEVDLDMPFAN